MLKAVKAYKCRGDVGVDISVPGDLLGLERLRGRVGHLFGIVVLQGPRASAVCAVCAVLGVTSSLGRVYNFS